MKRQIIPFIHDSVIDNQLTNITLSGYTGSFVVESKSTKKNLIKSKILSNTYPTNNVIEEYRAARVHIEKLVYEQLNKYHSERKSDRYWKIIMGHWIRRVSDMTLYKSKLIIDSVVFYKPCQVTLLDFDYSEFSCFGSEEWLYKSESLVWDSNIYNIIYNNSSLLRNVKLVLSKIPQDIKDKEIFIPLKQEKFRYLKKNIRFLLHKLIPNSLPVVFSTYFTFKQEVKLCIGLKTLPKTFNFANCSVTSSNYDYQGRIKLASSIKQYLDCELHRAIVDVLILTMPKCFLEDYHKLKESAHKQYAPRKPKFIITANAYDTNEIFKFWTALKVEEGAKYFVVQHGNNSGTHSFLSPSNEEEISDQFFTWGWMDKYQEKYIPMCIVSGLKSRSSHATKNFITVLQEPRLKLSLPLNSYDRWISSYESQSRLILGIDKNTNLLIKAKKSSDNNSFERLKEDFPWIQSVSSDTQLSGLMNLSKLVVHMYDSTGLYECLAANKPTVAFFAYGFQSLRRECYDAFFELYKMKVIFFDIDLLAEHINKVEKDIFVWWNSYRLQEARRCFCRKYARPSRDSVDELTCLIRQIL